MRFSLILLFSFIMLKSAFSQNSGYQRFASNWEVTPNIGMTSFYGDLTDKKNRVFTNTPFHKYFYQDRGLAYGFILKKNFSSYFTMRGSLLHGQIHSSSDKYNLYIKTRFNEYYLGVDFDISNLIWGKERESNWALYGFLGLGLTDYRTWQYDDETDELVKKYGFGDERWFDERREMTTISTIPFGFGVSYQFHDKWELEFETGIHGMDTDYLDLLKSEDTKPEGYGYTSLGLTYHFHLPRYFNFGGRPTYNQRSSDPAISEYNDRKRVVMKTRSYNRAISKRYIPPSERNFFRRLWESIKDLFRKNHYTQ